MVLRTTSGWYHQGDGHCVWGDGFQRGTNSLMLGVERDPSQDLIPLVSIPGKSSPAGDPYSHKHPSFPQPGSLLGQEFHKFLKLAINSQSIHPPS